MQLSRDNPLLLKSVNPNVSNLDPSTYKDIPPSSKKILDDLENGDIITKKRKLLEDKAPGLFQHLSKLAHEETSTDATSVHSPERDSEEQKHIIHMPTPIKDTNQADTVNLSNTIKMKVSFQSTDPLGLPKIQGEIENGKINGNSVGNSDIEEIQRQKILSLITYNTIMMNNMMNQQMNCQKIVCNCIEGFKYLKAELENDPRTQLEKIEQAKKGKTQSPTSDNNPTGMALFNHLFGVENQYKYELLLDSEIPAPIFRERNLVIKVKLVNILSQEPVRNENKILLHLGLQTWEIPSNPILRNKTGNKAIMGEIQIELANGTATFERIQINEVTSKFIHGHVALIVVPTKPINYGTSLKDQGQGENHIRYEQIKPLMLEKIVVKSKKKNLSKKKE